MEFQSKSQDAIDRGKIKEVVTDHRINKCEESITDINKCISGIDPKSSIDKDELIKLIASKAEREIDDKVSKEYFDEVRDKIMGKLKDTNNHGEELESRIKILERKIHEEATRISKFHPHTPDDNKKKNEFVPDMDGLHKRFSDIEGYIDSLRKTMKNIDQRLKKEITLLNDNKSDKQEQKEVEKELTAMKIKLDKLDLQVHQNKENIECKLNSIEREVIPLIDDKLKLHAEMLHISTTRIENIEIKIEQLNKIVNKNNKEDFDISIIQKFDEKLRKFGNQINIIQDDFELTIKEIRNILYTKADDESLTDLENKILLKLNELVENICK